MPYPSRKKYRGLFAVLALAAVFNGVAVYAAGPATGPGPNDALYMYKGADRNQKLLEYLRPPDAAQAYLDEVADACRGISASMV